MWKNVYPVYSAGIWTQALQNTNLLQQPLYQESSTYTQGTSS